MLHTFAGNFLKSSYFWMLENPGCYRGTVLLVPSRVRACASCPGRHTTCVFPPLSLSLAAKVGGDHGHRVVRDREVGDIKAGLVCLGVRGRGGPCLAGLWPAGPS